MAVCDLDYNVVLNRLVGVHDYNYFAAFFILASFKVGVKVNLSEILRVLIKG